MPGAVHALARATPVIESLPQHVGTSSVVQSDAFVQARASGRSAPSRKHAAPPVPAPAPPVPAPAPPAPAEPPEFFAPLPEAAPAPAAPPVPASVAGLSPTPAPDEVQPVVARRTIAAAMDWRFTLRCEAAFVPADL
jgi:hypothetical protein